MRNGKLERISGSLCEGKGDKCGSNLIPGRQAGSNSAKFDACLFVYDFSVCFCSNPHQYYDGFTIIMIKNDDDGCSHLCFFCVCVSVKDDDAVAAVFFD